MQSIVSHYQCIYNDVFPSCCQPEILSSVWTRVECASGRPKPQARLSTSAGLGSSGAPKPRSSNLANTRTLFSTGEKQASV